MEAGQSKRTVKWIFRSADKLGRWIRACKPYAIILAIPLLRRVVDSKLNKR